MKNNGKERDEKEGKWGKLLALLPLATSPCYTPGSVETLLEHQKLSPLADFRL